MASISLARWVFRIWLNPATASKNVRHKDPAASETTSEALLTKYIALKVRAFTLR